MTIEILTVRFKALDCMQFCVLRIYCIVCMTRYS